MVHLPATDRFLLAVVDLIHPWRSNVCPRVSRGRKIKEVIWGLILGSPSVAGSSLA